MSVKLGLPTSRPAFCFLASLVLAQPKTKPNFFTSPKNVIQFTILKGAGLTYLSLVADKIEEPFVPEYWYPKGLGLPLELIVVVESL